MEITGIIKLINEEQVISDKFKKREFVIEESDAKYPNVLMFELTQDRTDIIDAYKTGQEVVVTFSIRGREWTSPKGEVRYFSSLNAWKLSGVENGRGLEKEDYKPQIDDGQDDLPF